MNIFEMAIILGAVASALKAMQYVYIETRSWILAFLATILAFGIWFAPTLYYVIKDKLKERSKDNIDSEGS